MDNKCGNTHNNEISISENTTYRDSNNGDLIELTNITAIRGSANIHSENSQNTVTVSSTLNDRSTINSFNNNNNKSENITIYYNSETADITYSNSINYERINNYINHNESYSSPNNNPTIDDENINTNEEYIPIKNTKKYKKNISYDDIIELSIQSTKEILECFYKTSLSYHASTGLRRSKLQKSIQKYLPIKIDTPDNITYLAGKSIKDDNIYEENIGTNIEKPMYIYTTFKMSIISPQTIVYNVFLSILFLIFILYSSIFQVFGMFILYINRKKSNK